MQKINRIVAGIVLLFIVGLLACGSRENGRPREYTMTGRTMGTTYQIKVVSDKPLDEQDVQRQIDARLEQINQSMSTFRKESEISRFNALTETGKPFEVTADFLRVMLAGREMYRLTEGAWDGTVDPLINLWGFGKSERLERVPASDEIEKARRKVGFDQIEISVGGYLVKKAPDVTVDLGSIAKGYGVDQVALLLHGRGFRNYLVEIGGEVYAAGRRADAKHWRVGINRPQAGGPLDAVYKVVRLQNAALATSGDYRNFYIIDGRTYSHVIDPRTGYPVQNGVVSASVIADSCTLADALATALMVMGPQAGVAILDALDGVEGVIVVRQPDGTLEEHSSRGIDAFLES